MYVNEQYYAFVLCTLYIQGSYQSVDNRVTYYMDIAHFSIFHYDKTMKVAMAQLYMYMYVN